MHFILLNEISGLKIKTSFGILVYGDVILVLRRTKPPNVGDTERFLDVIETSKL